MKLPRVPTSRGACLRSRLARSAAATVALAGISASSSSAAIRSAADAHGSFTISGPVAGTIKVSATTCTASSSGADIQFTWFGGVKTLKGVTKESIVSMELDISNTRYGVSGKFTSDNGSPPFLSFGSTQPSNDWQSVSGTFTTAKRGASGSVKAELSPSLGGARKQLAVQGHWQDCKPAAS